MQCTENCYFLFNSTVYIDSFRKGIKYSYLFKLNFLNCIFKNFVSVFRRKTAATPAVCRSCNAMKNDLNQRFDFMIDENMDNFDCLYLLATKLDPNYWLFVCGETAVQNIVTRYINKTTEELVLLLRMVITRKTFNEEERGTGSDGQSQRNLDAHKVKLLYAKTVSASATPESHYQNTGSKRSKIQLELLDYMDLDNGFGCFCLWGRGKQKIDSLSFWTTQSTSIPIKASVHFISSSSFFCPIWKRIFYCFLALRR